MAPPRPNFPLAPWSLWLLAVVGVACGVVALIGSRPSLLHAGWAAGLSGLSLIAAAVAATTPEGPIPQGAIYSDSLAWLLLGLGAAGTVLALSTLSGEALLRQLFAVGVLLAALNLIAIGFRFIEVPDPVMDPMRRRTGIYPAQGIHWNINILGMIMGGALVLQVMYLRDSWRRLTNHRKIVLLAVGPFTSTALTWASSSRTAILAALISLAVAFAVPFKRTNIGWQTLAFISVCGAAVVAPLFAALGLGLQLNGRRNLWTLVVEQIAIEPFFGRGFGNINGEQHAHNQLLEVWLQAGIPGMAVLMGLGVLSAVAAVWAARWDSRVGVAIVTFAALMAGTEIISPWASFRVLPLPLLFPLMGVLASAALARDRGSPSALWRVNPSANLAVGALLAAGVAVCGIAVAVGP